MLVATDGCTYEFTWESSEACDNDDEFLDPSQSKDCKISNDKSDVTVDLSVFKGETYEVLSVCCTSHCKLCSCICIPVNFTNMYGALPLPALTSTQLMLPFSSFFQLAFRCSIFSCAFLCCHVFLNNRPDAHFYHRA